MLGVVSVSPVDVVNLAYAVSLSSLLLSTQSGKSIQCIVLLSVTKVMKACARGSRVDVGV